MKYLTKILLSFAVAIAAFVAPSMALTCYNTDTRTCFAYPKNQNGNSYWCTSTMTVPSYKEQNPGFNVNWINGQTPCTWTCTNINNPLDTFSERHNEYWLSVTVTTACDNGT
ncbi:MAG: hypothetical protein ACKOET_14985 [Verrucomicrobiota bacterium]